MKKAIKGLLRKNDFFFYDIDHEVEKEFEKKICGWLMNGFCSIFPKIIRGEKQNTRKYSL